MARNAILLVVGLAVGVGVGYVVADKGGKVTTPERDSALLEDRIATLERADGLKRQKIEDLTEALTAKETELRGAVETREALEEMIALSKEPAAAPEPEAPKPTAAATYADLEKAVGKLGQNFTAHMLGNDKELAKEIQELFARATAEDIQKFIEKYDAATDLGAKTVMAHLLGMSHHPDALKALETIALDKEQDMVARRLASHGLAFSGAESVKPLLRELAREDPDRGTRANAAFGLYRQGDAEGVDLYFKATDEAFAEKDPLAAAYLGGLSLMDDSALPAVRARLRKYDNWQAQIQLIHFIQGRKDKASVNLLTELARDESVKAEVRKAAEGAIEVIEKAE